MMWLYVALGGALGAMARHLVSSGATHVMGHGFPYGTLTVNILGSLCMGILIGVLSKLSTGFEEVRTFVAIGVLGSFTTFSTFSLDVVTMFERGETITVALYIFMSVTCSVMALIAGLYIMRMVA